MEMDMDKDSDSTMHVRLDGDNFTVVKSERYFRRGKFRTVTQPFATIVPAINEVGIDEWLRIFQETKEAERQLVECRKTATANTPYVQSIDMGEWLRITQEAREVDQLMIECRITRIENSA
jgi:hypothetical protein